MAMKVPEESKKMDVEVAEHDDGGMSTEKIIEITAIAAGTVGAVAAVALSANGGAAPTNAAEAPAVAGNNNPANLNDAMIQIK